MISSTELAALLEADLPRMTPVGAEMTRRAVTEIRVHGIEATSDSLNTRALLSAIGAVPELLAPGVEARLARQQIFGVASDYIGAVVRPSGSEVQIIIFEGFLAFLHHFASTVTLLNAFLSEPPGDPVSWRGQQIDEAEAVSLALFSLLAHFVRTGVRPPAIDHALNDLERQNVRLGVAASIAFAALHELAHFELGHLAGDRARSEIGYVALLEEEALSAYQIEEFEADQAALEMIAPAFRADIQSSLITLFGGHAFLEAFTGVSASHPLAINRLARLSQATDLSEADRAIVDGWVKDRAKHFRALAGDRRQEAYGLAHIETQLPVAEALVILDKANRRLMAVRGR